MQLAICLKQGQLIGDVGVLNYLFKVLLKHRVTASVDPENTKSIILLERIGFQKEAHFRKSYYIDGKWLDDCVYAILEEEWNSL